MISSSLLANLRLILRIVTVLGLIATDVMMLAILYRKLETFYPESMIKFKWVFYVIAIIIAFILLFMYFRFYETRGKVRMQYR